MKSWRVPLIGLLGFLAGYALAHYTSRAWFIDPPQESRLLVARASGQEVVEALSLAIGELGMQIETAMLSEQRQPRADVHAVPNESGIRSIIDIKIGSMRVSGLHEEFAETIGDSVRSFLRQSYVISLPGCTTDGGTARNEFFREIVTWTERGHASNSTVDFFSKSLVRCSFVREECGLHDIVVELEKAGVKVEIEEDVSGSSFVRLTYDIEQAGELLSERDASLGDATDDTTRAPRW